MREHPGPVRNRGPATTKDGRQSDTARKHIYMSKSTISTFELFALFPDGESARLYFEGQRWPDGPVCPACGEKDRIWRDAARPGYYRCNADLLIFTVRTWTIFERSKIPLNKWLYAMYLLVTARKGISSVHLAKQIGVTQKSAWFMLQRLREACGNDPTELAGIVEIDECYVGGREDAKHEAKREILDAVTARVFAYQPADKAKWAKSAKAKPPKENQDDSKSSI